MSDKIPFSRVGFFPSFPQPVQPPTTDIKASPTLALCFNEEWLPLIMGAVKVLMRPETYKGDIPTIIDAVANASQLVAQIGECETMREFRQDGCHLYTTLNGIETLIYNGQECIDANIADGTLKNANTGFVGDFSYNSCHTYHAKISTDENYIIPNVVNTGDTILLSNWQGGATDIGMLATTWVCPSGTAYAFGNCTDTARAATIYGTDPLQTAPHLAVIAQIGTTYYDVWNSASGITPATFTVPAGIVNQPCRIMMNLGTAVGLVASGEMWGEVTVCNTSLWCHDFDFTVSNQSWTALSGLGTWTATGWEVSRKTEPYGDYVTRAIDIQFTMPAAATIGTIEVWFSPVDYGSGSAGGIGLVLDGGTLTQYGKHAAPHIFTINTSVTNTVELVVDKGHVDGEDYMHTKLTKIRFIGSGTNPFGSNNCTT